MALCAQCARAAGVLGSATTSALPHWQTLDVPRHVLEQAFLQGLARRPPHPGA